jgi:hypothetical protein
VNIAPRAPAHPLLRDALSVMSDRHVKGVAYELVARGELSERFAYLFNGMHMEQVRGTTVLTGEVIDQAQLHGFIARLAELGVELISVAQIHEPDASTERGMTSDH